MKHAQAQEAPVWQYALVAAFAVIAVIITFAIIGVLLIEGGAL